MRRLGPRSLLLALLLPLAVPAGLTAASAATPDAAAGPTAVVRGLGAEVDIDLPTIEWKPCRGYDAPIECAKVDLPLDYDDPTGPTTTVGVLRVPASDQQQRIGTLFVNPGGPGGSATGFAAQAGQYFDDEVTSRFDVVGIDPRGVATSGFAWCRVQRSTFAAYPPISYPITAADARGYERGDRRFMRDCRADRAPIVDHMSTADTARDMDVVRQALGDEQITYYGISYGSYLGATYAALFPDRVRALIIDGVLDPVAWSTGRSPEPRTPVTYRLRSGEGAYESLSSALVDCDRVGRKRCPVAGDAYGTWQRVYRAAAAGRLEVYGGAVSAQDLVGNATGSLYDPAAIRGLMDFLAQAKKSLGRAQRTTPQALDDAWRALEQQRDAVDAVGPYGLPGTAAPAAPRADKYAVEFQGVLCSDSDNPTDYDAWTRTARRADRQQPWFGRYWTWSSSTCGRWPSAGGEDAFKGPWRTTTSTPLLVIGNFHDPATPISGARAANRLFEDSVLLSLDGYGHGALGTGQCIDDRMTAYLVDQRLPVDGRVCRPDRPLFP